VQAQYLIKLAGSQIDGSDTTCLGSQLIIILRLLEDFISGCLWYASDIDAYQKLPSVFSRGVQEPRIIGSLDDLIRASGEIDQFVSGIFLPFQRRKIYLFGSGIL
jgi:hypothetical protein